MTVPHDPRQPPEPPPFMMTPATPTPPKPQRQGLLLGLFIGGAVVVVAVTVVVVLIVQSFGATSPSGSPNTGQSSQTEQFRVNGCATQDGADAKPVDCADAGSGDYRITDEVEKSDDCPDPTMPVIKTNDQVFCLSAYKD